MKRGSLPLSFFALACMAAPMHGPKVSKDLAGVDPQSTVRVIIQWNSTPDDSKDQKVLNRGGAVHARFRSIKGGAYTLPASLLSELANDPEVAYITLDRAITSKLDNSAAAVNASAAWTAGWTGTGIGVAVVDSGINPDPNLGPGKKIAYTYDFTNSGNASIAAAIVAAGAAPLAANSPAPPTGGSAPDQYGHGQHIAGIIASNGQTSNCGNCTRLFRGIAPGVNLVDFRVLDQNGQGNDSTVILAIDAAIYLKNVFNIRVMNLSLGRPVYESYTQDPLCQAV
ncbi:MAG: S8 family serine peptidase, partial [Acidobacteriaceae bacterium]|nr:S8 family serine peptidase [Acidobacteriaceae bacterium]